MEEEWKTLAREAGWIDPVEIVEGVSDVVKERDRQINLEGFTDEHDDGHVKGELAMAGITYASHAVVQSQLIAEGVSQEKIGGVSAANDTPRIWPLSGAWWKPKDRRRNLVRAAALAQPEETKP